MPYDPGSKGGTEETVKIATADLVPTEANLRPQYACFAELEATCEALTVKVNARKHRESARVPDEALTAERVRLHVLPAAPHTAALGMTRIVNTDQTIRFGSVRYSTPPGLVGSEVWVGVAEVARRRLSTPGTPQIDIAHYPDHPQDPDGAPRAPSPDRATVRNRSSWISVRARTPG